MTTAITGLTAMTTPTSDDLLVMVDDPAGTPVTKKVTLANLMANAGAVTVTSITIDGASGNTLVVNTNTLVVDATNDWVGVGTASPGVILDIVYTKNNSTHNVSASSFPIVRNSSVTPGAYTGLNFKGSDSSGNSYTVGTISYDYTPGAGIVAGANLHIRTLNTSGGWEEAITINSNTHTLIGTTTDSGQLSVLADSASTVGLVVDTAASPTADIAQFLNNGTTKLVISHDGAIYQRTNTFSSGASSTTTIETLSNVNEDQTYLYTLHQQGSYTNHVMAIVSAYGANALATNIVQSNTPGVYWTKQSPAAV